MKMSILHLVNFKIFLVLHSTSSNTMEFRFFETPRKNKIRFENSGVQKVGGKTLADWKQIQGKQLLVRRIGSFEKSRFRRIKIRL